MQTLNLHDKHCVIPLTGPNDKFDSVCWMVRGKTGVVAQPRGQVEGMDIGVIAGSADGGTSVAADCATTAGALTAIQSVSSS